MNSTMRGNKQARGRQANKITQHESIFERGVQQYNHSIQCLSHAFASLCSFAQRDCCYLASATKDCCKYRRELSEDVTSSTWPSLRTVVPVPFAFPFPCSVHVSIAFRVPLLAGPARCLSIPHDRQLPSVSDPAKTTPPLRGVIFSIEFLLPTSLFNSLLKCNRHTCNTLIA